MPEQSGFRSSFRGFNRQDVMDYLDSLQADYSEREAGLRDGLSQANACLASLTEENKTLKTNAENADKRAEAIRAEAFERFEQMNAELVVLKKENQRLRAAAADAPASSPTAGDRETLLAALAALRERGMTYMEASCATGESLLDDVDGLLDELEAALADARKKVEKSREEIDVRRESSGAALMEMERAIKGEAPLPTVSQPTVSPSTPAQPAAPARPMPPVQAAAPAAKPTARLVQTPSKAKDGLRRLLEGLLG